VAFYVNVTGLDVLDRFSIHTCITASRLGPDLIKDVTLYPVEVTDFLSDLQGYTNNITKTKWEEITTELANVPELIDIRAKSTEIDESLSPIVAKDPGMQLIVKELERLRELLSKIKDQERQL
jgi:hypothetical protein